MQTDTKIWTPSERTRHIIQKEEVTPKEILDVVIECFCHAHTDCEQALYILKNQSINVGMIWEMPDKRGLQKMIPILEDISRSFRNPDIISANKAKIQSLLRRCTD